EPLRSLDAARVMYTYLRQERWLLDNPEVHRESRDYFFELTRYLQSGGRHLDALWWCGRSTCLLGPERRTLWAALMLLPRWAYHTFTRRPRHPFKYAFMPPTWYPFMPPAWSWQRWVPYGRHLP